MQTLYVFSNIQLLRPVLLHSKLTIDTPEWNNLQKEMKTKSKSMSVVMKECPSAIQYHQSTNSLSSSAIYELSVQLLRIC